MPANREQYVTKYASVPAADRVSKAVDDVVVLDGTVQALLDHMARVAYGDNPKLWPTVMQNAQSALNVARHVK